MDFIAKILLEILCGCVKDDAPDPSARSARAKQKQPKLPETIEEKSAGYDDETMSGYLKHSYNWLDGKMEWTLGEMKLAWDVFPRFGQFNPSQITTKELESVTKLEYPGEKAAEKMERLWEENAKIKFLQKNVQFLRSSDRQKVEKDIETVFLEHGLKKPAVEPKRVALEVHFMQRNFKLRTDPQAEILKNKKKKENSVEKMSWNEEWRNE
ncbi:unnamed protein product [Oikopleura dioica]|uniref:Uncharacterized protein n=1 Tax=Oikopleura dioica TaxID=34765 RepID=E4X8F5_OIKDI|nr:unnamed protein product [Oikopleura dioica]